MRFGRVMRRAALLAVVLVAIGPRDVVCDEGSLDEYGDFDEENEEGLDEFGEPIVPPAAAVVEEEPIDPPAAAVVEEVEEAMVPGHAGHKEAHRAIEAEEEARQQFYNSIGNDEDEAPVHEHEDHHSEHEQHHSEQHDQRWAAQEEVHEEVEVHEEDPYGDPYGAVWDEEEDEDEEVEYPGGVDFGAVQERAPDGVKRPPFSIKKWHDKHKAYVDPEDEKEYRDTEEAHLRESFSVGRMHGIRFGLHDDHRDDEHQIKMTAGGILAYFMAALNPDDVELHPDEVSVIEETVADMKRHEGLNDDKQQLFYGYVANGKPKKRLLKLMGTLNTMRTARDGIGAMSAEDQMNERDLLADM